MVSILFLRFLQNEIFEEIVKPKEKNHHILFVLECYNVLIFICFCKINNVHEDIK